MIKRKILLIATCMAVAAFVFFCGKKTIEPYNSKIIIANGDYLPLEDSVSISWTAIDGITVYEIFRLQEGQKVFVSQGDANTTSFKQKAPLRGVYYYRVHTKTRNYAVKTLPNEVIESDPIKIYVGPNIVLNNNAYSTTSPQISIAIKGASTLLNPNIRITESFKDYRFFWHDTTVDRDPTGAGPEDTSWAYPDSIKVYTLEEKTPIFEGTSTSSMNGTYTTLYPFFSQTANVQKLIGVEFLRADGSATDTAKASIWYYSPPPP